MADTEKLGLVAEITASYLRRNSLGLDQLGAVIAHVTAALQNADNILSGGGVAEVGDQQPGPSPEAPPAPAVSPRSSVKPDYIVCLDCGAKVKTLKRHLMSAHGLDPRAYRERWGLKKDYPMTAPSYSERRSAMARTLGLGRKPGERTTKRSRPKKATTAEPTAK
jgi:predicted transcriptional regulator